MPRSRHRPSAHRLSRLSLIPALAFAACQGEFSRDPTAPESVVARTDPGRVTVHRLNRIEYNNTVHDLLGTSLTPADDFPSDDRGYGYDNIADVLSLSPLQMELYQRAAEMLVNEAMRIPIAMPASFHFNAAMVKSTVGAAYKTYWNLYSNGEITAKVTIPADGQYKLSARAFGQQAGPDPARMQILVDEMALQTFDVTSVEAAPGTYALTTNLKAGNHTVSVSFINDFYNAMLMQDRNLIVDFIQVDGPLDAKAQKNPLRDRIVTCDPKVKGPEPCAREILGGFARRAFRRDIGDDEVTRLLSFITEATAEKEADPFEQGIRLALQAILISPHFVFRVEIDTDPASMEPHALSDYELAARLSYFLWSSTPDDALLAAAAAGRLADPVGLRAEVARLLADPRADALVQNFAGQWLFTRALDDHVVDSAAFPTYSNDLRLAMRAETQLFFREFLFKDATLDQLLTARFSYLNPALAKHYGIPFDTSLGMGFQKVALGGERRGLLGQASLLTVTSYPTRTSPTKRGRWVLEQLLCSGPPPPPPGVEGLMQETMPTGSLRQRLEDHRKNPNCASCHASMDPIGFGLEHYDGIGAFRERDSGYAIDATGDLPTLGHFDGAGPLADLLSTDARFPKCVARQLYTYALGRGPGYGDDTFIDGITVQFIAGGFHLRDLITLIVTSDGFRMRRGEPIAGGGQ